jgi:hypothetical protein
VYSFEDIKLLFTIEGNKVIVILENPTPEEFSYAVENLESADNHFVSFKDGEVENLVTALVLTSRFKG